MGHGFACIVDDLSDGGAIDAYDESQKSPFTCVHVKVAAGSLWDERVEVKIETIFSST